MGVGGGQRKLFFTGKKVSSFIGATGLIIKLKEFGRFFHFATSCNASNILQWTYYNTSYIKCKFFRLGCKAEKYNAAWMIWRVEVGRVRPVGHVRSTAKQTDRHPQK